VLDLSVKTLYDYVSIELHKIKRDPGIRKHLRDQISLELEIRLCGYVAGTEELWSLLDRVGTVLPGPLFEEKLRQVAHRSRWSDQYGTIKACALLALIGKRKFDKTLIEGIQLQEGTVVHLAFSDEQLYKRAIRRIVKEGSRSFVKLTESIKIEVFLKFFIKPKQQSLLQMLNSISYCLTKDRLNLNCESKIEF
jgi:hypothetical protein